MPDLSEANKQKKKGHYFLNNSYIIAVMNMRIWVPKRMYNLQHPPPHPIIDGVESVNPTIAYRTFLNIIVTLGLKRSRHFLLGAAQL